MYFGKSDPIPLPTTGHLHILKTGYVYWEKTSSWDKVKKQPAPGRVSIGKLDPDNSDQFFPNKKYFELFPGEAKKAQKEEEKKADQAKILSKPGKHSFQMNYGAYAAAIKALKLCGMLDALQKNFPEDWQAIIAVALHAVLADNFTAQDFPFWAFDHFCGLSRPLNDSEISDLFARIGQDKRNTYDLLFDFRENYEKSGLKQGDTLMVAGDSTNTNTHSKNNELAEYGKSKVDEGLPCINTFVMADLVTGIPLYIENYIGSLLDKTQLAITMDKVEDLGYQKLYIDLDRGYVTSGNVGLLDESEVDFNVMMSESSTKAKDLIEQNRDIQDKFEYFIDKEFVYGKALGKVHILDGDYFSYVYYDSRRASQEKASIETRATWYKEKVLERKWYSDKLKEQYSSWLIIEKTGEPEKGKRNFTVSYNTENIQKMMDKTGYFVVIGNLDLSCEEVILRMRARDRAEKVFCRMKDHLKMSKSHMHSKQNFEGKMLTCFVGLVICQSLLWFCKQAGGITTSDTLGKILGILDKYEIQENHSQTGWLPSYAMTKKQKALFEALRLSEEDIKKQVFSLK